MNELDKLRIDVAKAKGWIFLEEDRFIGTPDSSGLSAFQVCPDWPRDITAAWELVEDMRKKSVAVTITTMGPFNETAAYYTIAGISGNTFWGKTPPEVIVRVYLAYNAAILKRVDVTKTNE